MAAVQELPGGGRIAVWGDSQEAFSNAFTYVMADGYQNEIYNMQTIYWLLGRPLEKSTIAEARADAELNDTPDNLDNLVWVEGTVTAGEGNFYEMSYIQDDSGGIAINYPSLDLSSVLTVGMQVRVVGRLGLNQNETNIVIAWDPEQVQIIGQGTAPNPMALSTYSSTLELNEGWLIQAHGWVTAVTSDYEIYIDDGSGPVRVSIAGSGTFAGIQEGDWMAVIGLAAEDDQGPLIRLREQEDVLGNITYFPILMHN